MWISHQPSKNQYICKYLGKYLNTINSIFRKSCEKELITKEHTVMHTHLNFKFKSAVYFSTLDIKLLTTVHIHF